MIALFLDLDDTLFQSHRKNPAGSIAATRPGDSGVVSYMTPAQAALLECLGHSVNIVPVTARDQAQYQRALISQHPRVDTAVLYFGGAIWRGNGFDPAWQARTQAAYASLSVSIETLWQRASATLGHGSGCKLFNVDGYYVTAKAALDLPIEKRDAVFARLAALAGEEYRVHRNGRAISLYPEFIDKKHAVAHLLQQLRPTLSLAAGDSLTDLGFMGLCDFQWIPRGSQIQARLQAG